MPNYCKARTRAGGRCHRFAMRGKKRCDLHGGKATGPRTLEGKARCVAAMQEGRRRKIAELAASGLKIRTGRRRSKPRLPPEAQELHDLIVRFSAALLSPCGERLT